MSVYVEKFEGCCRKCIECKNEFDVWHYGSDSFHFFITC